MKRSTGKWVITVMAAALMAAPAAAQTAPPQPPTSTQPAASAPSTTPNQSADEHLRAASAALNDVQIANLSARAKTQVNELKRRVTALERAGSSKASATGQAQSAGRAAASRVNWGTEVAAMDKILTQLLGAEAPATGTATTTTAPTGTSGSTRAKPSTTGALDDASRAKLTEFRTHLTAYAAAMGGGSTAASSSPEPKAQTSTTEPPATSASTTSTSTSTTTAQPPATSTTTTQPPATSTQPTTAASAQADTEAARKHLTEARNTLNALTQLPAAAQLAGEARTQVSQLISNFNELITTQSNWRDTYAKVNANMTALLGPDTSAAAAAVGTTGATGTTGTTGTTGITLDPTVREKLTELRKHLVEFERASGGGAPASTSPNPPVEDQPPSAPATAPAQQPTGTSGTTPASAAADWTKHMNAIDLMLRSADESGGLTLDKAKVETLRTHLAELRKLLEKK